MQMSRRKRRVKRRNQRVTDCTEPGGRTVMIRGMRAMLWDRVVNYCCARGMDGGGAGQHVLFALHNLLPAKEPLEPDEKESAP